MSIPLTDVVYPLDESGQSPSNRILNERHELTNTTWSGFNLIIPEAAPFFDDSLGDELIHYPSGDRLLRGRDWITGWMFQSATGELGTFISSCIYFFDTTLRGQVEIPSYQCLGGPWQINRTQLEAILADKLLNPNRYYWEFVAELPEIYRPTDHDQDIDEISELGLLLDELRGIAIAIRESSETGGLELHESQRNPHRTRASDLADGGLGNVNNWTVALLSEMEDPDNLPADRYVAPPGVKRLIDVYAMSALAAFAARRDNPNFVTAAQTGTLTTDEIHTLIQQYLAGNVGSINANTLEGKDLQGVVDQAVAASSGILNQTRDEIIDDVTTLLAGFVALDTGKFNGMTPEEWDVRIENMINNAGNTTWMGSISELLDPEFPDPEVAIPDITASEATTTLIASIALDDGIRFADSASMLILVGGVAYNVIGYSLTNKLLIWTSEEPLAGYTFFTDVSTESNIMRLWMRAPANRPGITVFNHNTDSTIVSDGNVVFGNSTTEPPVVNTQTNRAVVQMATANSVSNLASTSNGHGTRLNNVEQVLQSAQQDLTTAEQNIASLQQRPVADLTIVDGNFTIDGGEAEEFNLAAILQSLQLTGYITGKAQVYVKVKNNDDESPNYESWINAEGVCTYGLRSNMTTAFVYNHLNSPVDVKVRVTVPRA